MKVLSLSEITCGSVAKPTLITTTNGTQEATMATPTGICPKCMMHRKMTRHHILPVRHWGRKGNRKVVLLCQKCHWDIEVLISEAEQRCPLHKEEYFFIVIQFLIGEI